MDTQRCCLSSKNGVVLDFSGSVCSSCFSKRELHALVDSQEQEAKYVTLEDICTMLFRGFDDDCLWARRVCSLDFSNSLLLSRDVPLLCEALHFVPHAESICLAKSWLLDDLDVPALTAAAPLLRFIIIYDTPIVSCEGLHPFLQRLSDGDLARLVLFEVDMATDGPRKEDVVVSDDMWPELFSDMPPHRVALIQTTHQAYYRTAAINDSRPRLRWTLPTTTKGVSRHF